MHMFHDHTSQFRMLSYDVDVHRGRIVSQDAFLKLVSITSHLIFTMVTDHFCISPIDLNCL